MSLHQLCTIVEGLGDDARFVWGLLPSYTAKMLQAMTVPFGQPAPDTLPPHEIPNMYTFLPILSKLGVQERLILIKALHPVVQMKLADLDKPLLLQFTPPPRPVPTPISAPTPVPTSVPTSLPAPIPTSLPAAVSNKRPASPVVEVPPEAQLDRHPADYETYEFYQTPFYKWFCEWCPDEVRLKMARPQVYLDAYAAGKHLRRYRVNRVDGKTTVTLAREKRVRLQ